MDTTLPLNGVSAAPRVAAKPLDPRMPRVQFEAQVDASGLPPGRHWLGLRLTGGDGSVETWAEQPVVLR